MTLRVVSAETRPTASVQCNLSATSLIIGTAPASLWWSPLFMSSRLKLTLITTTSSLIQPIPLRNDNKLYKYLTYS